MIGLHKNQIQYTVAYWQKIGHPIIVIDKNKIQYTVVYW